MFFIFFAGLGTYLVFECTILPERMSVYSPVSDWTSKNDLCIPAWLEKNTGTDWVHISFWGRKSIPHAFPYTLSNRIFHPKTTSESPLSSKKIKWLIWAHIENPQTLFAVGANQKIRRLVWAKAHKSVSLRLEAVQSNGIAGVKRNVLLYKGKNSKAKKRKACKTKLLSWKKGALFGGFSFSLLWHSYVLAIQLILYSLNFVAGHPPDFVLSWDE